METGAPRKVRAAADVPHDPNEPIRAKWTVCPTRMACENVVP